MKAYQYLLAVFFMIFLSSFGGTTRIVKENKVKIALAKVVPDSITEENDSIVMAADAEENFIVLDEDTQASYYHDKFTGRKTASGAVFNNKEYTAAHKSLPFGTKVKVTNLKNKRFVILTITDRGPFVKGRNIDMSKKAFSDLTDNVGRGVLDVKIEKFVGENEEEI
ncbi:septal ring lytic transglycosylase RlpA family protein [Myroides sp. M-43]|uniref:septal ring lytic transglycosylase RlpA family protein n=1 Tax=Myroides oncorhynchi TaxID=2893756 RepID=UPI001E284D90|nr:septal ring lytic transglycosylase RlpA family protein [Myroides oncorhynchi]MCC9042024.1 septal ring lytic transglycosylase RlpA family protein [Myroides oncorhynchi]